MADNDEIPTPAGPTDPSDIKPISLTDEMKRSYLDYAMSVIVSRALPDVRDGLKPVHRRILYAMHEEGRTPDKRYTKSATTVGDVMGRYHPHGDGAIYDALARLAQDFSMRLMLIDGQGNFGSVDGDPPAAMRYTESRLSKASMAILEDIDEDTVDYQANYDGERQEPTVLPARFPNLLVNGAGGIAVGMATNIPPHNLGEVVDGCRALLDNPEITFEEMMQIIPGPDFPTGGLILGRSGIRSAYATGRGSVIMRARATVEQLRKDREAIIVTEIPYQVNKANLLERIGELVREKKVEGISELRDESDRDGMRVVIELKRDAVGDVVLNQLYRYTSLQSSFGCNFVALNGGKPEVMNLRDFLQAFLDFREDVVFRRTKHRLGKARARAHELVGLAIAVANIDEVIRLIRTSADAASAREALMARDWPAQDVAPLLALIDDPIWRIKEDGTYRMSELQARAILDLRLQRLTALGRDEIGDEMQKIADQIREFLEILGSRLRIQNIVRDELQAVRDAFATPRRTEITDSDADMEDEDLIQREDMVVTFSHGGYAKRVPLSMYRAQRRGGKGRSGMSTKDEDFVTRLFVANTHTMILFFSSMGQVYKMKVWRLPEAPPNGRGKALVNLLPLDPGERITTILPLPDDEALWEKQDVMFATSTGGIRRNKLSDCVPRTSLGKRVMEFDDETQTIIDVALATEADDVLLTSAHGQCIRFPVEDIRVFGGGGSTGTSTGVRGIALAAKDKVISMAILRHFDAESEERIAYLKMKRAVSGDTEPGAAADDEEAAGDANISTERYAEMSASEQTVLTLAQKGYGKRTSSFEYRITNRGGKGITAMAVNDRNGPLVASFPVEDGDQIMLVTDGGQLIRCPVSGIRIAGRSTQGVIVFDTHETEKVVSVERISEPDEEGDDTAEADGAVED
ncbi:MAG: DNA gyrase subunit A [Beijerinckiaceae bacterium]